MSTQLVQPFDVPTRSSVREPARHTLCDPCAIRFSAHRMTRQFPDWITAPRPGELLLWRFRCGWLPVPIHESEQWLSDSERERARLNPNSALRKRFVCGRLVLRWIAANLFDLTPDEVQFSDGHADQTSVQLVADGYPVAIDIAYGGFWIVIGVASAALGLGITMPAPGGEIAITQDGFGYAEESVLSTRYSSLSNASKRSSTEFPAHALAGHATAAFVDLAAAGRWHVVDVPMPGKIRAAVSIGQPVPRIQALGWPKC